jgi:hypothetical protein
MRAIAVISAVFKHRKSLESRKQEEEEGYLRKIQKAAIIHCQSIG